MPDPARVLLPLVVAWAAGTSPLAAQDDPEVPFVPTPMEVVHTVLEMAGATSADTVYDLGSGDGRIPIVAARDFGARGVGVELDSSLVALSRRKAREAGVEDRVRFIQGDLFDVELGSATVLTLYLTTPFNLRLRPKILEQMRPGTKVVSHVFDMGRWPADSVVRKIEFGAFLYLWTVPADVEGRWRLTLGSDRELVVELDQSFDAFCSRPPSAGSGSGVRVEAGSIDGTGVRFAVTGLEARDRSLDLEGSVSGNAMSGRTGEGGAWTGARIEDTGGSLERWEPVGADEGGSGCPTTGPR